MNFRYDFDEEKVREALVGAGNAAMLEMARFVAARYVETAPKDTGYMVSTVHVTNAGGPESAPAEASPYVSGQTSPDVMSATVGPAQFQVIVEADYAVFQEMGFVTRSGTWVPPDMSFRLALMEAAGRWPEIAQSAALPYFGRIS